jgi:hypothetical protein
MKILQNYGLAFMWLVTAFLMVRDDLNDPYNPNLEGIASYGHNHQGALWQTMLITLLELAVLYAILRPWSYRRSWGRAVAALALFLPVAAFSMLMTMHAGGILSIHFFWLVAVLFVLFGAALSRWIPARHLE